MTDNDVKIITHTITRLLSMREHSKHELLEKLVRKGLDERLCRQQIAKFTEQNIQSDTRFVESFIRSKVSKGQGEQRIRAELSQHQVDDSDIHQALSELEIDWYELAMQVYQKKYRGVPAEDWKEKQKRARYLQYRGFNLDQINYAQENA